MIFETKSTTIILTDVLNVTVAAIAVGIGYSAGCGLYKLATEKTSGLLSGRNEERAELLNVLKRIEDKLTLVTP